MFLKLITFVVFLLNINFNHPIVTAQSAIEHKKVMGEFEGYVAPECVLICYQKSTLKYFLESRKDLKKSHHVEGLYLLEDDKVAILGGFGIGAPALACKVEQLIALGTKKFVAVGTAGALESRYEIGQMLVAKKAFADDGVACYYLNNDEYAYCDESLFEEWKAFEKEQGLHTEESTSWTFSAIFKETPKALQNALNKGCEVVEMEIATLYAIGSEKGVKTLTLLVVSDDVKATGWNPQFKSTLLKTNLHDLADKALLFCTQNAGEILVH